MSQIYLSTRQVGRLANLPVHVIYDHYRRHGSWRGVAPKKNPSGRLIWPATAVRRVALPAPDVEPNGLPAWLDLVSVLAPETPARDAAQIGIGLLGSESSPGWQPVPGQFSEARLRNEAGIVGLALQAWFERLDEAESRCGEPVARDAVEWLARVIRAAVGQRVDESAEVSQ